MVILKLPEGLGLIQLVLVQVPASSSGAPDGGLVRVHPGEVGTYPGFVPVPLTRIPATALGQNRSLPLQKSGRLMNSMILCDTFYKYFWFRILIVRILILKLIV